MVLSHLRCACVHGLFERIRGSGQSRLQVFRGVWANVDVDVSQRHCRSASERDEHEMHAFFGGRELQDGNINYIQLGGSGVEKGTTDSNHGFYINAIWGPA